MSAWRGRRLSLGFADHLGGTFDIQKIVLNLERQAQGAGIGSQVRQSPF